MRILGVIKVFHFVLALTPIGDLIQQDDWSI